MPHFPCVFAPAPSSSLPHANLHLAPARLQSGLTNLQSYRSQPAILPLPTTNLTPTLPSAHPSQTIRIVQ
ncbi:MAG: hypothetical protein J6Y00_04720 [Paludibacteraceae bacterium]|nr:hypothetical protein [Paludibacteraceae bacterium]